MGNLQSELFFGEPGPVKKGSDRTFNPPRKLLQEQDPLDFGCYRLVLANTVGGTWCWGETTAGSRVLFGL